MDIVMNMLFQTQQATNNITKFAMQLNIFARKTQAMAQQTGMSLKSMKGGFFDLAKTAVSAFKMMVEASPALQVQMELMQFYFSEIFRVLGDHLVPIFEIATEWVKKLSDWFATLPPPIQETIAVAILAGAAIGALVPVIAAVAAIGLKVIAVTALIVAAVGALYLAYETNFWGIRDVVESTFNKLKAIFTSSEGQFSSLIDKVKEFWTVAGPYIELFGEFLLKYIGNYIVLVVENAITYFGYIVEQATNMVTLVKALLTGDWAGAWEAAADIFVTFYNFVTNIGKNIHTFLKNTFGQIWNNMITWGRDMVEKLLEGFLKGVEELFGKDAANEIKKWLGFSLPEKGPLRQVPTWGYDMAEQFTKGLQTGFNYFMPNSLNDSMTPTIGGSSVAATHQTFNITVKVETGAITNDIDITELTEKIAIQIKNKVESGAMW